MPATGPRETASTPSDEPEQREYLLFANFLIAPDFMDALFCFVSTLGYRPHKPAPVFFLDNY